MGSRGGRSPDQIFSLSKQNADKTVLHKFLFASILPSLLFEIVKVPFWSTFSIKVGKGRKRRELLAFQANYLLGEEVVGGAVDTGLPPT